MVCHFLAFVSIVSYGGSYSVEFQNYKVSWERSKKLSDVVILPGPPEIKLSDYLRISHKKYYACAESSDHYYSPKDLIDNKIVEAPELPDFVTEKIALLESRRDWSTYSPEVCG